MILTVSHEAQLPVSCQAVVTLMHFGAPNTRVKALRTSCGQLGGVITGCQKKAMNCESPEQNGGHTWDFAAP